MTSSSKEQILKDLQIIPGIGKSIAHDLFTLGIRKVSDLKNKNPEKLYKKLCDDAGMRIDRCMLYTFRCAVYFASHEKHDAERLTWWKYAHYTFKKHG